MDVGVALLLPLPLSPINSSYLIGDPLHFPALTPTALGSTRVEISANFQGVTRIAILEGNGTNARVGEMIFLSPPLLRWGWTASGSFLRGDIDGVRAP